MVKVGDTLPKATLNGATPNDTIESPEFFKQYKKAVIFGVPGAFTPGCTKTHLPSYVKDYAKLQEKGVDLVACVAVNDAFVMTAWGEANGAEGKVKMLADPKAQFVKAMDLAFTADALGGVRSKRFSMVVENGVVKAINVEPDNSGLTCSLSNAIYKSL
ncbi:Peroxiredoxin-5, mitochondrial [Gaertneriomyces sp. JEL0708]|nr:Peroxiredoxin-5, mitochondrial [Gaertneriomyces sp. JEL0708]